MPATVQAVLVCAVVLLPEKRRIYCALTAGSLLLSLRLTKLHCVIHARSVNFLTKIQASGPPGILLTGTEWIAARLRVIRYLNPFQNSGTVAQNPSSKISR